nr:hypothetical protein [Tanacetum cinerariifolium]
MLQLPTTPNKTPPYSILLSRNKHAPPGCCPPQTNTPGCCRGGGGFGGVAGGGAWCSLEVVPAVDGDSGGGLWCSAVWAVGWQRRLPGSDWWWCYAW